MWEGGHWEGGYWWPWPEGEMPEDGPGMPGRPPGGGEPPTTSVAPPPVIYDEPAPPGTMRRPETDDELPMRDPEPPPPMGPGGGTSPESGGPPPGYFDDDWDEYWAEARAAMWWEWWLWWLGFKGPDDSPEDTPPPDIPRPDDDDVPPPGSLPEDPPGMEEFVNKEVLIAISAEAGNEDIVNEDGIGFKPPWQKKWDDKVKEVTKREREDNASRKDGGLTKYKHPGDRQTVH